ncbi:MAG TPA: hypothetical protein VM841_10455 [Actinomycetota bacterium]|nr:hypothetical protein [Actinomycetota bacterium]
MNAKRLIAAPVVVLLALTACRSVPEQTGGRSPANVEAIEGSEVSRITLTGRAAERLGIETNPVRPSSGSRTVVPYSAIYYDAEGDTWVFVESDGGYARAPVVVEAIEGERAILTAGPVPGTPVVVVGVAELHGIEAGIGQ